MALWTSARLRQARNATVVAMIAMMLCVPAAKIGGAASAASQVHAVKDNVLDVPISFTVANTNRSGVACPTDGKTYTIRGHLTGPASALAGAATDGTLYLHGLEVGEWFWRLPASGPGYVDAMAARGHVSVTIDRLGYNASS